MLPILAPPLDDETVLRTVSTWFSDVGDEVKAGDFLVELLIPGITETINAPCSGILKSIEIPVSATVHPNDTLGWIEAFEN